MFSNTRPGRVITVTRSVNAGVVRCQPAGRTVKEPVPRRRRRAFWPGGGNRVDPHRASARARFVPILRDQFGRHCHVDGESADGRARVRLAAPTPLDIARHLAGWGATIEVVEPRSVQTELARIGTELADRYATGR